MPSYDELERLRTDLEASTLPDVCNLLTGTYTANGQGGLVPSWGTAARSVSCRVDSIDTALRDGGASLKPYTAFMLTLPHGTVIDETYRVEFGGDTYSVVSVKRGKSWSACVRAVLEAL